MLVLSRVGHRVLVAFIVVTAVFIIMHAIGDPTRLLVNVEGTQRDLDAMKTALGLDRPLFQQYFDFLGGALHGDFGKSFQYQRSALAVVLERLPATLQLAAVAFGVAVPLGIILGIVAATHRNSPLDYLATTLAVAGRAMPSFFLGLLLILFFSIQLHLLPPSGYGRLENFVMPAIALGVGLLATVARLTRSAMLEVLPQDYIRSARGKGLPEATLLRRHALPNAMLPVVTIIALQVGNVLTGALIVETIFAWPGVGRLIVESIFAYDFPLVQVAVLFIAMLFVLANFAADLLYLALDPRIR